MLWLESFPDNWKHWTDLDLVKVDTLKHFLVYGYLPTSTKKIAESEKDFEISIQSPEQISPAVRVSIGSVICNNIILGAWF